MLREFNRKVSRGDHAVGASQALPGKLEGSPVVRARPWKWETERHIYALMEGM